MPMWHADRVPDEGLVEDLRRAPPMNITPHRRRVPRDDHPDTLRSANILVNDLSALGKRDRARPRRSSWR